MLHRYWNNNTPHFANGSKHEFKRLMLLQRSRTGTIRDVFIRENLVCLLSRDNLALSSIGGGVSATEGKLWLVSDWIFRICKKI